jgi:hypothetical protein
MALLILTTLLLGGVTAGWAKKKEPSQDRPADASRFSGFLDDYDQLETISDEYLDLLYLKPGVYKELADYEGIMIDQPELFIHPESKYQGMKPDDMKILADAFREIVITEIKDAFPVVEKNGPKVLYARIGLTNLYLKKKWSKNPLAYTPIGFVASTTKKALTKDVTKKISIVEANIELEFLNSVTGERLAAVVEQRGIRKDKEKDQKADPTSWEELDEEFGEIGARIACRLSNARKPEAEWVDCRNLPKPEVAED